MYNLTTNKLVGIVNINYILNELIFHSAIAHLMFIEINVIVLPSFLLNWSNNFKF